jgi:hypothetical protein
MTHQLHLRTPRILIALLIAAIAGVGAFMVAAPGAKAATGSCDAGDFCMWYLTHYNGGLYEWSGNDSNLSNDRFENTNTDKIVNNNTWSARNRGNPDPYDDVRVYDGFGYSGASRCIPYNGSVADLGIGAWRDRISSYKWVTSC